MRNLLLLSLLLLTSASTMGATQMIKATPSRSQLYLGESFTIDLTITPPENLAGFDIEATGPSGFDISPKSTMLSSLGAGSSYTVVYKVTPPSEGNATTEIYRIVFNVKYRHATAPSSEPQMSQSVEVPFTVTFSRERFYRWAMFGLFIGWLIKALSSFSGFVESRADTSSKERRAVQVLLAFLSRREIASLLTSLAMGFLALLLLSRHELPTGAVHDTLALGIGLGFLSDDQLLSRIKIAGGRP